MKFLQTKEGPNIWQASNNTPTDRQTFDIHLNTKEYPWHGTRKHPEQFSKTGARLIANDAVNDDSIEAHFGEMPKPRDSIAHYGKNVRSISLFRKSCALRLKKTDPYMRFVRKRTTTNE